MKKILKHFIPFTLTFLVFIQTGFSQKTANMKPAEIVKNFLLTVRAGKDPDKSAEFMAAKVLAHQVNSENPITVERTPQNYADHVREFIHLYGNFEFEITELIADGNKVYARWKQTGKHLAEIDGYKPTGLTLVEFASAVYQVENNKITAYWIQVDRAGFEAQLKKNAEKN
jgi:predicted ester cyclase